MEFTKPLYEVNNELRKAGAEIYRQAMTGEECAKMFAALDCNNPNIHELIDRHQGATGNDRYYCMMDCLDQLKVHHPYGFYREPTKTDSPDYVFDNDNVVRRRRGR